MDDKGDEKENEEATPVALQITPEPPTGGDFAGGLICVSPGMGFPRVNSRLTHCLPLPPMAGNGRWMNQLLLEMAVGREEVRAGHVRQRVPGARRHFRQGIDRLLAYVCPKTSAACYTAPSLSSCRRPSPPSARSRRSPCCFRSHTGRRRRRSVGGRSQSGWLANVSGPEKSRNRDGRQRAMIATTIMISTRVKPPRLLLNLFNILLLFLFGLVCFYCVRSSSADQAL